MTDVKINSLDGSTFDAHLALPVGGNGPGLILIHEIFGNNAAMKARCQAFADLGYITLCPNLFWRQGVSSVSETDPEPDWETVSKNYKNFDIEAGVRDLLATLAHIRKMPGCGGKVGAVGYCLGGRMAFLLASRSDVDCAVGYYAVGIDSLLDEVYDVRMPLLLHFAEQDKWLPAATRQRILSSLSRNSVIVSHVYPGVDHGFAREQNQKHDAEAAALASARTAEFLKANLLV